MWIEPEQRKDIEVLIGKTLESVVRADDASLTFFCTDGVRYRMDHSQDCCEQVSIKQIDGDLEDLCNAEIKMAEVVDTKDQPAPENADSYTWTFYKLGTEKGYVTIQWLGESNGYYSESVDFYELKPSR